MYKLFTPSQATEMLGVVDPMLRDLQGALHDALRLQRERSAVRPESLRARQLTSDSPSSSRVRSSPRPSSTGSGCL